MHIEYSRNAMSMETEEDYSWFCSEFPQELETIPEGQITDSNTVCGVSVSVRHVCVRLHLYL